MALKLLMQRNIEKKALYVSLYLEMHKNRFVPSVIIANVRYVLLLVHKLVPIIVPPLPIKSFLTDFENGRFPIHNVYCRNGVSLAGPYNF